MGRLPDGMAVFVPFTVPGDRVRARILEQGKRYAHAQLEEILEPSPERLKPPCVVFGECGGCAWQHVPYPLQWKTKSAGVLHALKRCGVVLGEVQFWEFPADAGGEYGYRNRIQLRGRGAELAFYAIGSQRRVPIPRCEIARPEINDALESTAQEGAHQFGPTHDYKVEIEVAEDGSIRTHWNARHAAGGFRQINDAQNEKLRAFVSEALVGDAPASGGALPVLLDLYGGAGNLSLALQPRYSQIHCVDVGVPKQPPADAGPAFYFHRAAVADWFRRSQVSQASHAILDPPREGLGGDFARIAEALEKRGAEKLVHVGCDVDAWARDMARWVGRGWQLTQLAAIDLFPQTPHVEAVGVLVKPPIHP